MLPCLLSVVLAVAGAGGRHDDRKARHDDRNRHLDDDEEEAAPVVEDNRVLVLDLGGDVDDESKRAITALVARDIARAGFSVLSGEDLRNLAKLEGDKQEAGCAGDESCLADLAGALDARLVVSGFAGRLGSLIVVNLSLFDAHTAESHGRASVEAESLEELPKKLGPAVDELIHDFVKDDSALSPGAWTTIGGSAGVVVAAGLGSGALLLFLNHQGERDALLQVSADHEKTQDDALVVDLADGNARVEAARANFNNFGVPLVWTASVVGAAGVAAVVAGAVMMSTGGAE